MKSSPDFQTGSILLLAATLICIGLAIAVIAPIIDSPLSASIEADTIATNSQATQQRSQSHPLVEFYPPIVRANHELKRSREMTGTSDLSSINDRSEQTLAFVNNVATAIPEAAVGKSLRGVDVAASSTQQAASIPAYLPQGSVYAPITIHQPAANSAVSGRQIADVAERIERLVTERERLAAAVETEKQRQSEIARRTRRKQATDFQQQQIARLEQELKLLNQSMTSLQTKTSTHLSRLEEQNSQIEVASQALHAYREALKIMKSESARSAKQLQLRTAEAPSESSRNLEIRESNKDDAGRVQIPILPSIPTHKHSHPAPPQPTEPAPQTANAPLKRLRVSAPVRTFESIDPEPIRSFPPLPTAREQSIQKPVKPTIKATPAASPRSAQQQMQFIPLDAPTIQEFPIKNTPQSNQNSDQKKNAKRTQQQAKAVRPIKRDVIPDLNVAFEHTYQFKSTPIIRDAAQEDVTEIVISTIDIGVPHDVVQQQGRTIEQPVPFQFEAIDFPDLSIRNDSHSEVYSPQTASISKTNVARQISVPNKLKPLATAERTARPQHKANAQLDPKSEPTNHKSWIQKVGGTLNPLQKTDGNSTTKTAQSTSRPHIGGRGHNRHLLRAEQTGRKRLKLSSASSSKTAPQTSPPKSKSPTMLQRIGNTLQRVGGTQK